MQLPALLKAAAAGKACDADVVWRPRRCWCARYTTTAAATATTSTATAAVAGIPTAAVAAGQTQTQSVSVSDLVRSAVVTTVTQRRWYTPMLPQRTLPPRVYSIPCPSAPRQRSSHPPVRAYIRGRPSSRCGSRCVLSLRCRLPPVHRQRHFGSWKRQPALRHRSSAPYHNGNHVTGLLVHARHHPTPPSPHPTPDSGDTAAAPRCNRRFAGCGRGAARVAAQNRVLEPRTDRETTVHCTGDGVSSALRP